MSFLNRAVVVTGASSGIGRELARQLAAAGARVGATARRADLLAELAAEVRAAGGRIETAAADVADRAAITAAVGDLAAKLGPIDVLIANAGVAVPSEVGPRHVDAVETMTRVNFLGVVYAFDAVLPDMLARGSGQLAAISSLAAYKGLPGAAGYCATKAAVNGYCESLRIELRGRGVAVTCVCPGFIRTAMTADQAAPMPFLMDPPAAAARILRAIARKRGVYDFPWPMRKLMWLAKWTPDRIMAKRVPIRVASNKLATDEHG